MTQKKRKPIPKQKMKPRQNTASVSSSAESHAPKASTVYKDFTVYDGARAPKWHPVRKMRYVFYRMIGGCTITDAIDEIHWNAAEFWHLVDLKRHGPFRKEYKRAKVLQGRSFSDSVVTIAEGRDRITRARHIRMDAIVAKATKRLAKSKNAFKAKMVLQQLLGDLREHDKIIMSRNKLQMDASKWMAKTTNPAEFGEKSSLALGMPDGDGNQSNRPFVIQFVGPDGKAVDL